MVVEDTFSAVNFDLPIYPCPEPNRGGVGGARGPTITWRLSQLAPLSPLLVRVFRNCYQSILTSSRNPSAPQRRTGSTREAGSVGEVLKMLLRSLISTDALPPESTSSAFVVTGKLTQSRGACCGIATVAPVTANIAHFHSCIQQI